MIISINKVIVFLFLFLFQFNALVFSSNKAAIFTINRSSIEYNDHMPMLEDLIVSNLTGNFFEIISRDNALKSLNELEGKISQKSNSDYLSAIENLQNKSSVLRLSQNLNVEYIIIIGFQGLEEDILRVDSYGSNFTNHTFTGNFTYQILSSNTGASLFGGNVWFKFYELESSKLYQQTEFGKNYSTSITKDIFNDAAIQISKLIYEDINNADISSMEIDEDLVEVFINTYLEDFAYPKVRINNDGEVIIQKDKDPIELIDMVIEIDGVLVGSTSQDIGSYRIKPGIHNLSIYSENVMPFERIINVSSGATFNIGMKLNESAVEMLQDKIDIFDTLLRNTTLTKAQIILMESEAEMLRNSGYKIDIKIDTDEGLKIYD